MNERPILFSAPMVRAILEGRKTQTRRVVKPQPSEHGWSTLPGYQLRVTEKCRMADGRLGIRFAHSIPQNREWDWDDWTSCPYGAPGDRLWVRETWREREPDQDNYSLEFLADRPEYRTRDDDPCSVPWRPSIHMPRVVSRINLEVTGVRVERLQDCSESDAFAEGVGGVMGTARSQYADLWCRINGPGSWASNPWVWVVEFPKRVTK